MRIPRRHLAQHPHRRDPPLDQTRLHGTSGSSPQRCPPVNCALLRRHTRHGTATCTIYSAHCNHQRHVNCGELDEPAQRGTTPAWSAPPRSAHRFDRCRTPLGLRWCRCGHPYPRPTRIPAHQPNSDVNRCKRHTQAAAVGGWQRVRHAGPWVGNCHRQSPRCNEPMIRIPRFTQS